MSTKIAWTDESWNPVVGCSPVSPGCKNCYAVRSARRQAMLRDKAYDRYRPLIENFWAQDSKRWRWSGKVELFRERLEQPLHWRKPRRIFPCSMSDLFHESVPFPYIAAVFGIMAFARDHTFQVLTKRPARALEFFRWLEKPENLFVREPDGTETILPIVQKCLLAASMTAVGSAKGPLFGLHFCANIKPRGDENPKRRWPLPNVWLGVTTENQQAADERTPLLLQTPAAVRFVSCEPLLEPLSLHPHLGYRYSCPECGDGQSAEERPCSCGGYYYEEPPIDWAIIGGESGPGARPCSPLWIYRIVEQCRAANVACFVKQFGANLDRTLWGNIKHCSGADPAEWPEDLRVREYPNR